MISRWSVGPGSAASVAPSRLTCTGLRMMSGCLLRLLLDDSRLLDRLHERLAAAITAGKLANPTSRNLDQGVVNLHPRERGHAVLDGFDKERAVFQASPPRALHHVTDQRRDGGDLPVLLAHERDARIGTRRSERQLRDLAREESRTFEGCLARKCALTYDQAGLVPNQRNL